MSDVGLLEILLPILLLLAIVAGLTLFVRWVLTWGKGDSDKR